MAGERVNGIYRAGKLKGDSYCDVVMGIKIKGP